MSTSSKSLCDSVQRVKCEDGEIRWGCALHNPPALRKTHPQAKSFLPLFRGDSIAANPWNWAVALGWAVYGPVAIGVLFPPLAHSLSTSWKRVFSGNRVPGNEPGASRVIGLKHAQPRDMQSVRTVPSSKLWWEKGIELGVTLQQLALRYTQR